MISDWETQPLGKLCSISIGKTPSRKKPAYWDITKQTSNVWLSIADLKPASTGYICDSKEYISDSGAALCKSVPPETLLLSFKLTIGKTAFTGRSVFTNEAIAALKIVDDSKISKEFLRYALMAKDWDATTEADAKIKGRTLNKSKLQLIPISYPSMPEQRRIVAILDEAFGCIDSRKSLTNQKFSALIEFRQSILESAFANGLDAQRSSRNHRDWQVSPLGDLCSILDSMRRPVTKRDRIAGDIPYYGATGVQDYVAGFVFNEPLVLVGEDGAKWGAGDRTAFAVDGKSWVNNHAHVLRPDRSRILDAWLIYYLNATDLTKYVSGLTVPKLNQANLKLIPVPIPAIEDQRRLVGMLDNHMKACDILQFNAEATNGGLDELKASLLNQAFAGEL